MSALARRASAGWADPGSAAAMFRALQGRPGNLLFSPHSVAAVLGMLRLAARGDTEAEIAAVLPCEVSPSTTGDADVEGSVWRTADALWAAPDLLVEPAFVEALKRDLGAMAATVVNRRGSLTPLRG